jgi:predicted aspartyl protease
MSTFKVNIIAVNPRDTKKVSSAIEALVDTRAELTWLHKDILHEIGIEPVRKRSFMTATKQIIQREIGYAILRSEGYETIDEVVFAETGDMNLLGVRTLEGFGVMVDNVAHRFVAITTLAV